MERFDVVVAGAGLGGLCAAAGLRRAGLRALVLERDAGLDSRPQGYRININSAGDAALRACLPSDHFALYRDTSHAQGDPSADIFSTGLELLFHRQGPVPAHGPAPSAVDRGTLRAILLDAAHDAGQEVRFGSPIADALPREDGVRVILADGGVIEAGLLLAADGSGSILRRRYAPGNDPRPLGTVAIYGRAPLDLGALAWLPRGVVEQRFVGVTDGAGTTLALGSWNPRLGSSAAASALARRLSLPATAPYVMWALLCPAAKAPPPDTGAASLHQFALAALSGWNPAATQFVARATVSDTFLIPLRAMDSVPSWTPGRITFLGDAIHAMSPAGGEGANTALADAASLVACLAEDGWHGLARYERDLRTRAREALLRSSQYGLAAAPCRGSFHD